MVNADEDDVSHWRFFLTFRLICSLSFVFNPFFCILSLCYMRRIRSAYVCWPRQWCFTCNDSTTRYNLIDLLIGRPELAFNFVLVCLSVHSLSLFNARVYLPTNFHVLIICVQLNNSWGETPFHLLLLVLLLLSSGRVAFQWGENKLQINRRSNNKIQISVELKQRKKQTNEFRADNDHSMKFRVKKKNLIFIPSM